MSDAFKPLLGRLADGATLTDEDAGAFFEACLRGEPPPAQVAALLRRLFARLDCLAAAHGVQRVDVIGDCYLAATNLLEDQPDDHAARLACFALDMVAAVRGMADGATELAGTLSIRVGLHCGPVSGSVVAPGSGRYTLIGETVNVAAAMEREGAAGRVQCSGAFAALAAAQGHNLSFHRR